MIHHQLNLKWVGKAQLLHSHKLAWSDVPISNRKFSGLYNMKIECKWVNGNFWLINWTYVEILRDHLCVTMLRTRWMLHLLICEWCWKDVSTDYLAQYKWSPAKFLCWFVTIETWSTTISKPKTNESRGLWQANHF